MSLNQHSIWLNKMYWSSYDYFFFKVYHWTNYQIGTVIKVMEHIWTFIIFWMQVSENVLLILQSGSPVFVFLHWMIMFLWEDISSHQSHGKPTSWGKPELGWLMPVENDTYSFNVIYWCIRYYQCCFTYANQCTKLQKNPLILAT
jgi:hypothetical protein